MDLQRIYSNENVSVGDRVIHLKSKHIGIVLNIVGNGYVIVKNVTNKNLGAWICFARYIAEG